MPTVKDYSSTTSLSLQNQSNDLLMTIQENAIVFSKTILKYGKQRYWNRNQSDSTENTLTTQVAQHCHTRKSDIESSKVFLVHCDWGVINDQ